SAIVISFSQAHKRRVSNYETIEGEAIATFVFDVLKVLVSSISVPTDRGKTYLVIGGYGYILRKIDAANNR
ncbi:MAG: hypothetical protein SWX82_34455, partial [Cyanobacteriota bacterium]|nr:hypothetical protein [Cyanobacteriota bacterium]